MRHKYNIPARLGRVKNQIRCLVLAAACLYPASTRAALTDDLLGYWSFEENLHESINDFHGSARGTSPIAFVDGKTNFGKALKLNGTNFVEITGGPVNGLDSPNGSLSIAGWFKVDAFDKSWQALIAKGENSNYRIARRSAENTIAYAGGTGEGANDTPNINDTNWHHFVAVTDANTNEFGTALYIDGVRRSVNMAKPALTASTSRLFIGENPQALGRQWKGEIDDLAIWKRVLTAGEVSFLYNGGQGAPLSTVAPIGAPIATLIDFPFDEGQGVVTRDTVNGLTGIFGQALDATHLPVLSTNVPGDRTNDLSISFNEANATNRHALVVDDRFVPILNFPTNQAFTIETWINPDPAGTNTYEGLVAYGRSATNVGYKLGLNNGQLLFTLFGVVDLPSGIFPTKGEWHHVASVWRPGTGVEFFLDGVSVTNVVETRLPKPPSNNFLTIGAENVGATNFVTTFQGKMDRVRVHRAALTAAQLDNVAATPKVATTTTVVSYNFDAGMPFNSSAATNKPAISSTPNNWPAWTTITPSGQPGDSALRFAARQHIEVPNTNNAVALSPTNASFTIQAWVNFQTATNRMVFYFNNGPGGALSFSVFTNRNLFVTTLGIKDQTSNAKVPDDGNWHHVAVVHEDKKEFRFYVDGALADTQPYTGGVNFTRTNQVFYIGSEPTFGLQYVGLLDRLKVSKSMLTAEQLDFPAGGTPPQVVSVGALGSGVGVVFDRPVSATTALNAANYTVSGTTVTNVTFINPNYVLLGLSGAPASPFNVTVSGVANTGGDRMSADVTLTAPTAPGGTVPSGLVAHWSFDGHLLDSVNGFDGVARGTNNPVAFVEGPRGTFGKSLKLNGTNYVEIPGSSNALQFANGSLSIAGWFKVDRFDKGWQALIAKGEASNYRIARRDVLNTIAYAGGAAEGANDTPNINDTNWHHFVAITDATAARFGTALYIDGALYSIITNKPALQAGTANLFIGENPEARNRNWVGEIDDVGLWNRVLAPQEVALLYNSGQGNPVFALPGVVAPIPADRPFTVGLNFGAAEPNTNRLGTLALSDVAGAWPQANWNNLTTANGTNVGNIIADTDLETAADTTITVSWQSNGLWANTGRGEENNRFIGADRSLMLGYLDTGNATTTSVTITNVPSALTSNGYDVYVHAMGGVGGRGGGYRVLDAATRAVIKDYVRVVSPTNSVTYVEALTNPGSTNYAVGNYMVFTDITAPAIIIEATTGSGFGFSATPRAPINAIQLVAIEVAGITAAISHSGGNVTLSWTGGTGPFLVQRKGDLTDATWMNVGTTASTSITLPATGGAAFFRIQERATNTVQTFRAVLSGGAEVPAVNSPGSGTGIFSIEGDTLSYDVTFQGMNGNATMAHIHGPAATTAGAGILVPAGSSFTVPSPAANSGRIRGTVAITDVIKGHITGGMTYFNIHSTTNGGGEIRGQLVPL